jgi:2,3-bisphosphoglycerate-independent phosphoglycerate mutase
MERTKKAYDLITQGIGNRFSSFEQAIDDSYSREITDEFVEPVVLTDVKVGPNDVVIHMNYRSDRALQLSSLFAQSDIPGLLFIGFVEYRKGFPSNTIIPKQYINLSLGRVLSSHSLTQLRIAESEKFPHVTYFFNGGVSIRYENEDRIEVPSPKVALYDQKPEMSAFEMTDILINRIEADIYNFILVNFANPDMVAHTGNIEASVKSVQAVDKCVKSLVNSFTSKGGIVIITADHGNAEELLNLDTNEVDTEHSLNPVPFIVVGSGIGAHMLPYGSLKDVAPTILDIMGLDQPIEMTGRSLLPRL